EKRRYALLQAARDNEYVKKVHGGYLNVFMTAMGEDGDTWDLFRVVDGEFPEDDQLHDYDGFVVSGSTYDAFGREGWILRLCLLLQKLVAMKKRVLGVCFGHQVLCHALGGKVGRSGSGWDVGVRKITLNDDDKEGLTIIECHQDEVLELPKGGKLVAYSEKTGVEMFEYEDNVMGIQGHPEYTKDILEHLIDRLLSTKSIPETVGEKAKLQLVEAEADRKQWESICRNFLRGK
ncbi:hypothetical protein M569_09842, partial [Genlisea aurea]